MPTAAEARQELARRELARRQTVASQTPAQAAASSGGFLERMGDRIGERRQEHQELQKLDQPAALTGLESFINVAGGAVVDPLSEGVTSLFRTLPDAIENPIRQGAGGALSMVGSIPLPGDSSVGEVTTSALTRMGEQAGKFAEEHPRTAHGLKAVGTAAELFPASKAVGMGLRTGRGLAKKGVKTLKDITPKLPGGEKLISSREALDHSRKFYKSSEEVGALVDADTAGGLIKGMQNRVFPKDIKDLKSESREAYYKAIKEIEEDYAGETLTLENLINIDQKLTAQKNKLNVGDPSGARKIGKAQEVIREFMDDPPEGAISGGKLGFELYREGTRTYSKAKRMEAIENIVAHAESGNQPSSAIKSGLRTLRKKIREERARGYTPEEVAALDKAISSKDMEGILRALGSRFTAGIGAGVAIGTGLNPAAVLGAAGLQGVSALSRMGAEGLKKAKVNKLLKTIQPDLARDSDALQDLYRKTNNF